MLARTSRRLHTKLSHFPQMDRGLQSQDDSMLQEDIRLTGGRTDRAMQRDWSDSCPQYSEDQAGVLLQNSSMVVLILFRAYLLGINTITIAFTSQIIASKVR